MRPAPRPRRPARHAERASLVLLAAGVATYGIALAGMRRLEQPRGLQPGEAPFGGLVLHAKLMWWSELGLLLVAVGMVVAVAAAAWTAWHRRRQATAATSPAAPAAS